jgi:fructose-1,6-bisphosphatase/inositol monophosphatase family enzyme
MSDFSPKVWRSFVSELIAEADKDWLDGSAEFSWFKDDGSRISGLDLRLDATIRILLARHFPDIAVLTEETGFMAPAHRHDALMAIADPIDGTDSLIRKAKTWWISIGIFDEDIPLAGLIYQPAMRHVHDSASPSKLRCEGLVVGLSPDHLNSPEAAALRARLAQDGTALVSTPHAVEKVAAVLEGRCAATAYLPSKKSPWWRPWDLAGCVAIAEANKILLTTLDGEPVRIDAERFDRGDIWICAADQRSWDAVRRGIG